MRQLTVNVIFILAAVGSSIARCDERPNVLFIVVDDLRPELGCYGAAQIHSPNIDAFAATGMVFERAYCQQAVCNPSRTSFMTGMRPDATGVVGNHAHFRTDHPDVITLPQHFRRHGYHTAAIGKIYHGVFPEGASITKWDTMGDPESWSVPAIRFGPRYYFTEEGIAAARHAYERIYKSPNAAADDWTKKLVFGPATESPDVPDGTLYDGKVADTAVRTLQQLKLAGDPFFLAVGFIKPHSPYIAPKKYFDLYGAISPPGLTEFPTGAPRFAGHGSGELRRYTDQPKSGPVPDANQQRVRHAYFACISFIDAQIGRVLNELDGLQLSENTIVVLFGDHGYHLGEQGLWGKTTNFELDTRVPLIVRVPGMKAAGESSSSLVELIDLYPTLAELAGLPVSDQLEGTSLAPILDDPDHVIKNAALSQYPRNGGLMGYSMRTATQRLTQWVHRESGMVQATEFYDYADGLVETSNLAGQSPATVERLSAQLESLFGLDRTDQDTSPSESFEEAIAGEFDRLETAIGTWLPDSGRTLVDDKHAKTGKHCLQLTGGTRTRVILELADHVDASGVLTFWAERWTSRSPFSFRIESRGADGWTEVFNGDRSVRVGRAFLNQVKIPLSEARFQQLRFTVTSPENTGVLIDDIGIAPAEAQRIVAVEPVPLALPALISAETAAVAKLRIETTGLQNPLSVTRLHGTLDGTTDRSELASVLVRLDGEAQHTVERSPDGTFTFLFPKRAARLREGENVIWVSCKLHPGADIDHRVAATITEISFSKGQTVKLDAVRSVQRMGVAVRQADDDGVHTYRIPGLVTTDKGTLIGVYDIRRGGGGDLPGDIDVGMSRSTDGGRTWEPMKVIMDMGDDPEWHYDGIGDPAVLVDRGTGTIWVAGTWSHGNRSWRGSGPGLEPEETGQLMLVRSDDDGITWSDAINITKQVKRPEWCFLLQGPGKGITMRDGTIVFAAQYQDPPDRDRLPHSTILYSRDHGRTWQVGRGACDDTTEAQVVEVEPGVLMLNCRYNRKPARVVMTTRDMGKTWQKHTTSERALVEPGACMASLIDADREVGGDVGGWLLFSNPDSMQGRHHITIKASPDRGMTWPKDCRLLLDEGGGRGYSCMTMIDENTIGILYEGSQAHLTFQRIPLQDLVDPSPRRSNPARPADSPKPPAEKTARSARQRPNILLIVGEDHGCELSCYGDPVIQTPNIDRLASGGVLFERGYVTQAVCSPSRSTIFTGLYPHQNGQLGLATHGYGWFRSYATTYSLLKESGYRTGLIGKTHVIPADAVEAFVDFRFQESSNFAKRDLTEYARKAGEFFRADDNPFFMTVNYPDAHWPLQGQVDGLPSSQVALDAVKVMPYVGLETSRLRAISRDYYNCMLRLDACVGQLLKQLNESGKADNTLVVFISDHGAQMARGKVTVYEGGVRVPYIVRWPGITKPGLRSQALVSTIDLLPTMMDAAGARMPIGLPGKSLRTVLQGSADREFREYLACERNCDAARHTFPQRTIRDARYKLIHSPVRDREDPAARYYRVHGAAHWAGCPTDAELAAATESTRIGYARWLNPPEYQLYDLQRDPCEWNDLAADPKHAAVKRRLQTALKQWQAASHDPLADPDKLRQLVEENDAVFQTGRRSPQNGWKYLTYLCPEGQRTAPAEDGPGTER